MQRCSKFGNLRGEPATMADYDKFLASFEDNHPGACDGRSVWVVYFEKLDEFDHDKNREIHACRNLRIMESILGSKDYHEQHRHLHVGISQFFTAKNVLIHDLQCKSGCQKIASRPIQMGEFLRKYVSRRL